MAPDAPRPLPLLKTRTAWLYIADRLAELGLRMMADRARRKRLYHRRPMWSHPLKVMQVVVGLPCGIALVRYLNREQLRR